MQSYDGKCALRDSLDQNLEPLRAMYKELRASFGLTTTPPKGTKKKELGGRGGRRGGTYISRLGVSRYLCAIS